MTGMTRGIVAGYDGFPGGAEAVRWAAREARARGTTLTICLAWMPYDVMRPAGSALADLARRHGEEILAGGLSYAQSALGSGRVRPALVAGSAARVLCSVAAPRWSVPPRPRS